jgi:hypothetical protein
MAAEPSIVLLAAVALQACARRVRPG